MSRPNALLVAARTSANLTQGTLAELANAQVERATGRPGAMDADYISKLERGVHTWPTRPPRPARRAPGAPPRAQRAARRVQVAQAQPGEHVDRLGRAGREAQGHAGQGDAARTHAVLRRARNLAERSRHDDDPAWIDLYGPAEFASHERRAALLLGDMAATEEAARAALALSDPVAFPRNHALYLTYLADVLVRRRELDEGATIARQATVAAAGLDSARVTRQLQAVTQRLAAAAC